MVVRTAFTFALRYNKDDQPLYTFNWNYPLRLALWEVTLDYLFVSLSCTSGVSCGITDESLEICSTAIIV